MGRKLNQLWLIIVAAALIAVLVALLAPSVICA